MLVSAEGRVENQNEPKRPPLCGLLGSFWFSTRLGRKKGDPPSAANSLDGPVFFSENQDVHQKLNQATPYRAVLLRY